MIEEEITTVPFKCQVVYMTTNLVNGKKYIGKDQNNNPNYFGSGHLFKKALKKYGKGSFKKEILAFCGNVPEMNAMERHFIWLHKATSCDKFYNIASGGDGGNLMAGLSPERKAQLNKENSLRQKGRKATDEARAKMRVSQNLPHNVAKKSQVHRDLRHTDEVKARISKTLTGLRVGDKHPLFGKNHTEEAKNKISKAGKKSWLNPEYKKRVLDGIAKSLITKPRKRGKDTWNYGVKCPEHSARMTGKGNPYYGKSPFGRVRMLDYKTGKPLMEFENPTYAKYYLKEKYNTLVYGTDIAKCCNGIYKRMKGFKWEFIDV